MLDESSAVARLRAFNRSYTRIMGLLEEGLYKSPFPLAEARVLHETGRAGEVSAGALAESLGMDRGQLSRLIKRLTAAGVLRAEPDPDDRRISRLSLTGAGLEVWHHLNRESDALAAAILAPLGGGERGRLVAAMGEIERLLDPTAPDPALVLRPPEAGELGWFIHRQAGLYHREYGWNAEFEALIARVYAQYVECAETERKALWVADLDGAIAGSVFVIPAGEPGLARLRALYAEPRWRGRGIGTRLVAEAIAFARKAGYARMTLWTQDCLVSARRIYEAAGFRLVSEECHHSFGHDLNGQNWERDL